MTQDLAEVWFPGPWGGARLPEAKRSHVRLELASSLSHHDKGNSLVSVLGYHKILTGDVIRQHSVHYV